jgi:hypothetical protein
MRQGHRIRAIGIAATLPVAFVVGSIAQAAATTAGRHIQDRSYQISFYVPTSWAKASITESTTGAQKLLIIDPTRTVGTTVAQVIVLPGRQITAAQLATVLRKSGASVAGAHLTHFRALRDVEQLSYSESSNNVLVHGIAEGFYQHKRTYYVVVNSSSAAVTTATVAKIMDTWGT